VSRDERSKVIKLAEKHCRQMMELIYKKKIAYFEKGGDEDWKGILVTNHSAEGVKYWLVFRLEVTLKILRKLRLPSITRSRSTRTTTTSSKRWTRRRAESPRTTTNSSPIW